MLHHLRRSLPLLLCTVFSSSWAAAQWSNNAAQWSNNAALNLAIGDRVGDQAVPKIAAIAAGGCYIGWFDNAGTGYEVRLQRLDVHGVEQWPHDGIVVSANPQSSSLVDWDVITDSQGNCVLAFTDTRTGGDLDVYAYRIDPAGTQLWGANGVTLSANPDFEANPRVCETTVGDFAFVWSNTVTSTLRLQRLDQAGVPLYAGDGIGIAGDAGVTPTFVRVAPSDNGAVILSWVRALAFSATKHIHAQKYDLAGTPLWNGGVRLPVFDLASLPIAHDPRLRGDGIGGAVIAWHYSVGSVFSVRVQHLDSNGTELFGHNGVDVSTNANSKFDPALTIDAATQECIVVWNERNTAQSMWGISAQKVDLAGTRLWGASGVTLLPIDTVNKLAPVSVPFLGGAMAFVLEATGAVTKRLRGMRVDGAGAVQWTPPVDVSSAVSDKLRVLAGVSQSGMAMVCWSDARTPGNGNDIFAQNIGANALLAPAVGDVTPYGCGGNPAGSLVIDGRAALGETMVAHIDNPPGTQTAGASVAVLAFATAPQPGFPCGVPLPGFGMSAPGSNGELLIDTTAVTLFTGPVWTGPGQPAAVPMFIPVDLAFYGIPLFFQGALVDFAPGAAIPIGLTTAARWTFGF